MFDGRAFARRAHGDSFSSFDRRQLGEVSAPSAKSRDFWTFAYTFLISERDESIVMGRHSYKLDCKHFEDGRVRRVDEETVCEEAENAGSARVNREGSARCPSPAISVAEP